MGKERKSHKQLIKVLDDTEKNQHAVCMFLLLTIELFNRYSTHQRYITDYSCSCSGFVSLLTCGPFFGWLFTWFSQFVNMKFEPNLQQRGYNRQI